MDYSRYFWQGKKVRLRGLRPDDAEQCYSESLDTPLRQTLQLETELPTSVDKQREFLEKFADCKDIDGMIIFTIETLDGVNVGGISLHSRHRKNGTFAIGLDIAREHWRNGYAEDAARILLRYCFREQNYQKCNSGCVHTNEASIALHKKLGFIEEGRLRRTIFFNGRYHDDVQFGITREEFEQNERGGAG